MPPFSVRKVLAIIVKFAQGCTGRSLHKNSLNPHVQVIATAVVMVHHELAVTVDVAVAWREVHQPVFLGAVTCDCARTRCP